MRGHAINLRVSNEHLSLRVPNLYALRLGTPCPIANDHFSFFDCKLRKLIIVLNVKKQNTPDDDKEEEKELHEIVDTKKLENDMLFDIV